MNTNEPSFRASVCRYLRLRIARISLAILALFAGGQTAPAFTTDHADAIIDAYNSAFYVDQGSSGYYRDKTNVASATWFWGQAEEIEMLIDAYERTGRASYYTMMTELCNGFVNTNGTNWMWNEFNDDVMWACIAFLRVYQHTGNTNFRTYAKNNFDACHTRAWDTAGGGGLWWTTAQTSKTHAVNGPAGIVAHLLYQTLGTSSYLTTCQTIFNWNKANLYNSSTGRVYDSTTNQTPTTYNQGTFIGTANYLGDVTNATLAATYTMNNLGGTITPEGYRIMPQDNGGDNAGFNGIFMRWMAKFMSDRNVQGTYLPWLRANANAAWDHRRTPDNLAWNKWWQQTPTGVLDSFDCMPSVVALQVIPADVVSDHQYAVINRKSGKTIHPSAGGSSNGTNLLQQPYATNPNMRWALESLAGGQYRLRKVTTSSYATVEGSGTANDDPVEMFTWQNANHQKFTLDGRHGLYYGLVFVHSGRALTVHAASTSDNAAIIQYFNNGGLNAQWQFRDP